MSATHFQRIWLPGFLLQSMIIGGGYATGRELVEFFLKLGPTPGLLGILVATIFFSTISALCFEFARLFGTYNYRSFFKGLLGRFWFLYDISYLILGLLVLAVLGAASGELFSAHLGLGSLTGTILLLLLIGILVFWGTALIERVLAGWSFVLYATYFVFVVWYLWEHGSKLEDNFTLTGSGAHWFITGVKYVGYNIAALPAILYCVKHMNSRRDAFLAGSLAGPLAMFPGIFLYLAMAASYPDVVDIAVPTDYMMRQLGSHWFQVIFYIVIFGTFVETGAGYIHAVNERINDWYDEQDRIMPRWFRLTIGLTVLVFAVFLAEAIGLIQLIDKGYGTLTWAFIVFFVFPLCTLGLKRIFSAGKPNS